MIVFLWMKLKEHKSFNLEGNLSECVQRFRTLHFTSHINLPHYILLVFDLSKTRSQTHSPFIKLQKLYWYPQPQFLPASLSLEEKWKWTSIISWVLPVWETNYFQFKSYLMTSKHVPKRKKMINWASATLKIFALWKTLLRRWKTKQQSRRKYL